MTATAAGFFVEIGLLAGAVLSQRSPCPRPAMFLMVVAVCLFAIATWA